ncbi:MAG: UDP-4-amino-4,6-dideoxy-N-acetyl-beta-L-altrosamine transaminase [Proteobacteria bacterium]|nr:UDP-4-amino-4,6-dideoxy-N-acetyl-beta-L-altrosamine transaminase [Pseudomonadota bacterium]
MISYGRQSISLEDIEAVTKVLSSDFLTQGPQVPHFEREVAEYCGAEHACAVNSATSALHIACLSLGLGPGDWLWTTPITFVSSANCALYCGAKVDFVDIDPDTCNLSIERLEEKLVHAKRNGCLPKILVPVHLAGQSCDMRAISELAQQYKFYVIEDAAHAVGGRYLKDPVGSCRFSDIAVFSFHPVKIITTGEGGMALTNNPQLSEKMHLLRSHGITRNPEKMTHVPDGEWYYQQIALGFNYRMTDIQAALGRSQLKRVDEFVARRQQLAARYNRLLEKLPVVLIKQYPDALSSFHLYVIRVNQKSHMSVFSFLREAGIGVNLHYIPVHTQPYYRQRGFHNITFPIAESYYREAVSLPIYPELDEQQQDIVVSALGEALAK